MPSVTRVFNKSQEMYVYLEAYEPAATATEPIVATVAFYRGRTKAFEIGADRGQPGAERQIEGAAGALQPAAW